MAPLHELATHAWRRAVAPLIALMGAFPTGAAALDPTVAAPTAIDAAGPTTGPVALSPSRTALGPSTVVALTAAITDRGAGDAEVVAAEYSLDVVEPVGGHGIPIVVSEPAVTVVIEVGSIDLYGSTPVGEGTHRVIVRGVDAHGNWGEPASASLVVDATGPQPAGIVVSPDPVGAGTPVHLAARVRDPEVGDEPGSAIGAVEYFLDADPGVGAGGAMTATDGLFDSPLESVVATVPTNGLAPGTGHSVCVRAQDSLGNWTTMPVCTTFRISAVPGPAPPAISPPAAPPGTVPAPTLDHPPGAPVGDTGPPTFGIGPLAASPGTGSGGAGPRGRSRDTLIEAVVRARARAVRAVGTLPAAARRLQEAADARDALVAALAPVLARRGPLEPWSLEDALVRHVVTDGAFVAPRPANAVVAAISVEIDEARRQALRDVDRATARLVAASYELTLLRKQLASARRAYTAMLERLGDLTRYRVEFAAGLLDALQCPVTSENVRAIVAWTEGEGMGPQFHNPLATTLGRPGAVAINAVGVKRFSSEADGLTATVQTLTNGLYEKILAALRAGTSAEAVARAIADSPWGTGELPLRILQRERDST